MKSPKNIRFITIIVSTVFFVCFALSAAGCLPKNNRDWPAYPSLVPPRTITDATLPFREKWRVSNLLIYRRATSRIYEYGDRLFFVAYRADGTTHWLEVLDAKNGSSLWKTQDLPFPENSLAADQQKLYLALAGKILAYDLFTGEILWETQEPLLGHTIYWVYPMKDTLLVYSEEDVSLQRREQIIRVYDMQNGSLKSTNRIVISQNDSFLLKTTSNDYWTNGTALWAINRETSQKQWLIEINNPLEYQPLSVNSRMIFASGMFSEAIGIDNITGTRDWTYEGIVSDLAAAAGIVYAVRSDATLVGIDSVTGKEAGYIEIEPRRIETDTQSTAYLVAATEDMIYAYYGDSQELIAFSK